MAGKLIARLPCLIAMFDCHVCYLVWQSTQVRSISGVYDVIDPSFYHFHQFNLAQCQALVEVQPHSNHLMQPSTWKSHETSIINSFSSNCFFLAPGITKSKPIAIPRRAADVYRHGHRPNAPTSLGQWKVWIQRPSGAQRNQWVLGCPNFWFPSHIGIIGTYLQFQVFKTSFQWKICWPAIVEFTRFLMEPPKMQNDSDRKGSQVMRGWPQVLLIFLGKIWGYAKFKHFLTKNMNF